jgi:hypothetical protein
MARQIINTNTNTSLDINFRKSISTELKSGPVTSDRVLLQKRSSKFIQALTSLDTGTLTDTKGFAELIDKLKNEFGELGITEIPLGIVSKCYLGHPYEVHVLDLSGTQIINHYKRGESLPPLLEKARNLAIGNQYVLIEVYAAKMILVKSDGTTTKL